MKIVQVMCLLPALAGIRTSVFQMLFTYMASFVEMMTKLSRSDDISEKYAHQIILLLVRGNFGVLAVKRKRKVTENKNE